MDELDNGFAQYGVHSSNNYSVGSTPYVLLMRTPNFVVTAAVFKHKR